MDYELLVEDQIEDGKALISGLRDKGFDVSVALWVRSSEEGLWFLYLGKNSVRSMSLADAYRVAYGVLRRVANTRISLSSIKIVDVNNPIARAAIEVRDRYPARLATRYNSKRLASMAIDEAYIYPRGGEMTRSEVLQTVTGLMNRTGILSPSLVTFRDGTHIQAVPVGIQMNAPGAIHIVFHDTAGTNRSIPVDSVVGIM